MHRSSWIWYVFLIPTILGIAIFMVYPIIEAFRLSFFQSSGFTEKFVGLQNYKNVLASPTFLKSIYNTFYIAFFYYFDRSCSHDLPGDSASYSGPSQLFS